MNIRKKRQKRLLFLLTVFVCFCMMRLPVQAATKAPATPSQPSVYVNEEGTIYVSLNKEDINNVSGYQVYFSRNVDIGYEYMGAQWVDTNDLDNSSFIEVKGERLSPGTYYVKVKTFNLTSSWKYKYSSYSEVTPFVWQWNVKTVPAGNNGVKLITNGVYGPIGTEYESQSPQEYEIYRSESADGEFHLIKTCNEDELNGLSYEEGIYTDSDVQMGANYYYKIRALFYNESSYDDYFRYDEVKPSPAYELETGVTAGHPGPVSTESLTSKANKSNQLKLSWNAVAGVDGYYLYEVQGMERKQIAKMSGETSYTWKNRTHAVQYKIVVVPYVNVNGTEVTGAESDIFPAVMNYYTSPYDDKVTRFFGTNASKKFAKYEKSRRNGKPYYSSAKTAAKQMQTIVIKVWDYKKGKSGKKITRQFHLTVHKKVAPSLKKAFDEIYKGKEKFPIHDIGGYSYRWGQHGVGLAIDINSNENAQFKDGKAVVGSFYRPGKNPYSIPPDGEVAKILHKYGFDQLEGDYMHFSYFGT